MVKVLRADQVIVDDAIIYDEAFSGLTPYEERKLTQRSRRAVEKARHLDRKQKRNAKRIWS